MAQIIRRSVENKVFVQWGLDGLDVVDSLASCRENCCIRTRDNGKVGARGECLGCWGTKMLDIVNRRHKFHLFQKID